MVPEEWAARPLPLKEAQSMLLQAALWVDDVCRREGIMYWLDWGTLLGAVRSGGFIPWDDDIDLGMLRNDFHRFTEIARGGVPSGYRFATRADESMAPNAKLYLEDTLGVDPIAVRQRLGWVRMPLAVDFFVQDPVSDFLAIRKAQTGLGRALAMKPWAAAVASSETLLRPTRKLKWAALAAVPSGIATGIQAHLVKASGKRRSNWLGCALDSSVPPRCHSRATVVPTGSMEFEGNLMPVPADPTRFLRDLYGDGFLTPPPVSEQRTHLSDLVIFDSHPHDPPQLQ